jgi:hypothetical protein
VLADRVCRINRQGELEHTSGRRPDTPSDRPIATVHHLHKSADSQSG